MGEFAKRALEMLGGEEPESPWETRVKEQEKRLHHYIPSSRDEAMSKAVKTVEALKRFAYQAGYALRSGKLQEAMQNLPTKEEGPGVPGREVMIDLPAVTHKTAAKALGGDDNSKLRCNPKELAMGIKVEMEHTPRRSIAEQIARDHLAEIPDYYTRLKKMEREAEKKGWFDPLLLSKEAGTFGDILARLGRGTAGAAERIGLLGPKRYIGRGRALRDVIDTAADLVNAGDLAGAKKYVKVKVKAMRAGKELAGGFSGPPREEAIANLQRSREQLLSAIPIGAGAAGLYGAKKVYDAATAPAPFRAKEGAFESVTKPLGYAAEDTMAELKRMADAKKEKLTRVTSDPKTLPFYYPALAISTPKAFMEGYQTAETDNAKKMREEMDKKLQEAKTEFEQAMQEEYSDKQKAASAGQLIDGLALVHVKEAEGELNTAMGMYLALASLLGMGAHNVGKSWVEKRDPRYQKMKAVKEMVMRRSYLQPPSVLVAPPDEEEEEPGKKRLEQLEEPPAETKIEETTPETAVV